MRLTETLYLAVPQPTETPPPGADKLATIGGWAFYVATAVLVIVVIVAGVKIAMGGHGRGNGGEHGLTLLMAGAGAIVCGVAGTLVTTLL